MLATVCKSNMVAANCEGLTTSIGSNILNFAYFDENRQIRQIFFTPKIFGIRIKSYKGCYLYVYKAIT